MSVLFAIFSVVFMLITVINAFTAKNIQNMKKQEQNQHSAENKTDDKPVDFASAFQEQPQSSHNTGRVGNASVFESFDSHEGDDPCHDDLHGEGNVFTMFDSHEGDDPCHDEHPIFTVPEEPEEHYNSEIANELLKGVILSEILGRRKNGRTR